MGQRILSTDNVLLRVQTGRLYIKIVVHVFKPTQWCASNLEQTCLHSQHMLHMNDTFDNQDIRAHAVLMAFVLLLFCDVWAMVHQFTLHHLLSAILFQTRLPVAIHFLMHAVSDTKFLLCCPTGAQAAAGKGARCQVEIQSNHLLSTCTCLTITQSATPPSPKNMTQIMLA